MKPKVALTKGESRFDNIYNSLQLLGDVCLLIPVYVDQVFTQCRSSSRV
jgi:hypothetical protein